MGDHAVQEDEVVVTGHAEEMAYANLGKAIRDVCCDCYIF
jgi:hypothetical protein